MRAFVAIPLPPELLAAAAGVARGLAHEEREWRVARDDGLHLTLRFLGQVDPDRLAAIDAPLAAAAQVTPVLELTVRGAGAFPTAKRPRVLWLGVDERRPGGALAALAARLEEVARGAGFAPETRPFFPHVTLARARADRARVSGLEEVGSLGTFVVAEVVLFRSVLGPGGARYAIERRYPLGTPP